MKGFRKQLFISTILLSIASMIIFFSICFSITVKISVDNMTSSYLECLHVLDDQTTMRLKMGEEAFQAIGERETLKKACDAVQQSDTPQNIGAVKNLLAQYHQLIPQFDLLFVITEDYFITENNCFLKDTREKCEGLSMLKLIEYAQDILKKSGISLSENLQERNVFYVPVSSQLGLAAVMTDSYIFAIDEIAPVWVKENNAFLIYNSETMTDHHKEISYTNPQSGMRYTYFLNLEELWHNTFLALRKPLNMLIFLEILMVIAVYFLSGWAVSPFTQLTETAKSYQTMPYQFSILLNQLKTQRGFQFRVFILYGVILIPIAFSLFLFVGSMKESIVQVTSSAKMDEVTLDAMRISENIEKRKQFSNQLLYRENINRHFSSQEAFNELLIKQHAFQQGVKEAGLYGENGKSIWRTSSVLPPLLNLLENEKNQSIFIRTSVYDPSVFSVITRIESQKEENIHWEGYLYLSMDDVFSSVINARTEGRTYLYDRSLWRLVATPLYLNERFLIEGMCQGRLLNLSENNVSHVTIPDKNFQIHSEMHVIDEKNHFEQSGERIIFTAPVKNTPYTLICVLTMEPILSFESQLQLYMGMFLCAFLLLMLTMNAFLSWRTSRLFRQTEKYFCSATLDNYDLPDALKNENEISALAYAFKETIESISNLSNQLHEEQLAREKQEKRRTDAEIIALQSQLDSHLIGNVFAGMKLLIAQKDYVLLSKMVDATSDFLRNGLVHNEYDVPLQDEILYVKAYIVLQSIRYADRLQVIFEETQEDILHAYVPKYLLQPLIENAIVHGMRPHQPLRVILKVEKKENCIQVTVEDNGIGMSEKNVADLTKRLKEGKSSRHIGLLNVAERIRLRFGEQFGIKLESHVNIGTKVTLLFPIVVMQESYTNEMHHQGPVPGIRS